MAYVFPGVNVVDIDEQQLNGYLQHVEALGKIQSASIASAVTQAFAKS